MNRAVGTLIQGSLEVQYPSSITYSMPFGLLARLIEEAAGRSLNACTFVRSIAGFMCTRLLRVKKALYVRFLEDSNLEYYCA